MILLILLVLLIVISSIDINHYCVCIITSLPSTCAFWTFVLPTRFRSACTGLNNRRRRNAYVVALPHLAYWRAATVLSPRRAFWLRTLYLLPGRANFFYSLNDRR